MRSILTLAMLAGLILFVLLTQTAHASNGGCPMCGEAAKSLGESGQRALNLGIVMMMVPVAFVIGVFGYMAYSRRRAAEK